jgi:hypothetical protein
VDGEVDGEGLGELTWLRERNIGSPFISLIWLSAVFTMTADVRTISSPSACRAAQRRPWSRICPELPPLESAVRDAYQREFAVTVPVPAVFKDERSVDCAVKSHVTTTAYTNGPGNRSTLLQMYLSHDGTRVEKKAVSRVITPAGTFKALVVIVRYGVTVSAEGIKLFERAQKQINEDHAVFARSRGYAAPLIVFDNTNVVVEPDEFGDPDHGYGRSVHVVPWWQVRREVAGSRS